MLNPNLKLNPKLFNDDALQVPIRKGFGEGLVIAGTADKNVVALCADLTESTRSEAFSKIKEELDERVWPPPTDWLMLDTMLEHRVFSSAEPECSV